MDLKFCPFCQRIQTGPPRVDPAHEWESENDKQFGKIVKGGGGGNLSSETFSCGPQFDVHEGR